MGTGNWLGDLDHSVEDVDGDGDLTFLIGCRPCPQLRTDHVFVATDRRLDDAVTIITIGLLSGQAFLLGNVSDMTIANGLNVVKIDDRTGSWGGVCQLPRQ